MKSFLKFRLYDRKEAMMFLPVRFQFNEKGELIAAYRLDKRTGSLNSDLNGIELMQSTGLLDKNGIEIFEGDIVHSKLIESCPYRGAIRESHTVVMDIKRFCTKIGSRNWENTILGNIYENQEILRELKGRHWQGKYLREGDE